MLQYNATDLAQLEQRKRATFINSLAGVKPAVLVGTADKEGHHNLAVFNSLIHIGANPPLYGLVFRPDTVRRDTLHNILTQQVYTLNYLPSAMANQAHQTSAKYAHAESEFEAVGLSEYFVESCNAPFVKEACVKIGMKLEQKIEIPINGTQLIIGSIQYIELNAGLQDDSGFVNLSGVLSCAGLDAYYHPTLIKRLSYAQPHQPLVEI